MNHPAVPDFRSETCGHGSVLFFFFFFVSFFFFVKILCLSSGCILQRWYMVSDNLYILLLLQEWEKTVEPGDSVASCTRVWTSYIRRIILNRAADAWMDICEPSSKISPFPKLVNVCWWKECSVGLHYGFMFYGGCLTSERLARITPCSVNISACWWWTAQDWSKVSWEPVYGPCLELKWTSRLFERDTNRGKSVIFDGSGVWEDDYTWNIGHP